RSYLTSAFLGGLEGRRRVMFLLFVVLWPVSIAVSFAFAGGHHVSVLLARMIGLAAILAWLLARRRPSNAEWIAMWTIGVAGWFGAQYAVGSAYAGVFSVMGITLFMATVVAFDRFMVGYLAVAGGCAYAAVQLHFHPTGRALLAVLLFVICEALV